ncbi:MAG: class I SAM-dependent methyltransferase [Bdellovibrionales bacterium]
MKKDLAFKFQTQGPFLFVDKVSGQNTHAVDLEKPGLAEMIQEQTGLKVYTVSRLDQGTSGALVFATTPESAQILSQLFETKKVQKNYLFLSDKKLSQSSLSHHSKIEKAGKRLNSDPQSSEPNAFTEFEFIKSMGPYFLHRARPKTGKTHQIRLHAQELGIPLLGDQEHGGAPFHRLCLHSLSVEFEWQNEKFSYETALPAWAHATDLNFSPLAESFHRRQQLMDFSNAGNSTLRWVHNENSQFHLDQYGSQLWAYWYSPQVSFSEFEKVQLYFQKPLWIREMKNRGSQASASQLIALGNPQPRWVCEENSVKFELRSDQGLSPGLFLDQRENRLWVKLNSHHKKVLNLFAYTGGFSLNAALGGASEVTTVDVSSQYLDWSKTNFKLNGLDTNSEFFQFWTADSQFFLKSAIKRQRKFDLIICDPPSLGRSKEGVFRIEKDLKFLLELCLKCLTENGKILLSTNYEKWTLKDMTSIVESLGCKHESTPCAGLDFELPHEPSLMKSLLVSHKLAKQKA